MTTITELSVWNKEAQRTYVSIALCFPCNSKTTETLVKTHINEALARVVAERPAFGGQISLGEPGARNQTSLYLWTSPNDRVTVESRTTGESLETSYSTLRTRGFPASFFTNRDWSVNGNLQDPGDTRPILRVAIQFLDGGFILFFYLHHSYGDGGCMNDFLNCLSKAASSATPKPSSADWQKTCELCLPTEKYKSLPLPQLLKMCPEYNLLPTSIPKRTITSLESLYPTDPGVGRTYVISTDMLDSLRRSSEIPISRYSLLAAITWVFTTQARLSTLSKEQKDAIHFKTAVLFNPLDWSAPHRNLFPDNSFARNFFGNTILSPIVTASGEELTRFAPNITGIARMIQETNRDVDEEFVLKRTALLETGAHARHVGVSREAKNPGCWGFNTWESLGTEADFGLIGKPEAIRRVQGAWAGTAHGIILPRRKGVDGLEVIITLEKQETLTQLETATPWMKFVSATDKDM
ncbi:hypothetical protein OQA88_9506 [Cercophora sp. LCS_1]